MAENRILVMRDVDIVEDMKFIFDYVKQEKVELIIIDSLSASLKKSGLTEQSPELTGYLYKFQSLVHEHEVCCILLHHTTKLENADSQTDRLKSSAGKSGLVRANDGQILLKQAVERKQVLENTLDVFFDLRHGVSGALSMRIKRIEEEANQCHWIVEKETMLSEENILLQNSILRLLYQSYLEWIDYISNNESDNLPPVYGYTLRELMQELNESREVILPRLNWMSKAQGIEIYRNKSNKQYVYHYPSCGESWLYKYIEDEEKYLEQTRLLEEEDNRVRMAIVSCTNYEQIQELVKDLAAEDKKRIFAGLSKEDQLRVKLLKHPPLYNLGSNVFYKGVVHEVKYISFSDYPVDVPLDQRRVYLLKGVEDYVEESKLEKVPDLGISLE